MHHFLFKLLGNTLKVIKATKWIKCDLKSETNIQRKYSFNLDNYKSVYKTDFLNMRILFNNIVKANSQHAYLKSFYSTQPSNLTHVDNQGKAHMVDVGDKEETDRTARAEAVIFIGERAFELIQKNLMKKGDVLTVAQIAGIMGAKKTSELIPMCHNINLLQVKLNVRLEPNVNNIVIDSFVRCKGTTGVEMEALTGVTVAALTIYDMCKAVNKGIIIQSVRLLEKTGGKSGDYHVDVVK